MRLFETERLSIRRLTLDDVDAMLAIYGDRETVRFVGDAQPLAADSCRYWVEVTDRNFDRRGYGMVALVERSTGDLIGCAGVVHPGQQDEPEVKYAFRRDRWGEGFATEAVKGLVGFARSAWGVGWMMATVAPGNAASQHVLSKAGFLHTKDRENEDGTLSQIWELDTE